LQKSAKIVHRVNARGNQMMNYAKLIKRLRDKLILSQTELASMLGVSFTTISRWEQDVHEPTIKMKRKIAEFCKQNRISLEE